MKKILTTLLAIMAFTSQGYSSTGTTAGDSNVSQAARAAASSSLVINEVMASNAGIVLSPAINFDSWIELYNPTSQAVNLSGMYLSNDATRLKGWQMPSDIGTVPAKGFLVVWFGSNDIKSNQAPFKLDCDGDTIFLSDASGQLITRMIYPEAKSRTAYARTTDGGEEWSWTANPTPGATNATSIFASKRLDAPVVSQGSQLFSGMLNVKVDIPANTTLMYTTDGSLPQAPQNSGGDDPEPTSGWVEMLKNGNCEGDDATCFVCRDGDGDGQVRRITDGVGYNGSRGIKVHAVTDAPYDWSAQFFIYVPDYVLNEGDMFQFSMKVRADKSSKITPESQGTPGTYIYWDMLEGSYTVGTQWRTITYEGTITASQAGESGMSCIAFKLNEYKEENNFYFDDLSWKIYKVSSPWKNWVINSDGEGDDATSFVCRDGDGDGDIPRLTDGVGYKGSRGAFVHTIDHPKNDWDSQFFVYTPDHVWEAGDHYRFSMKARADKESWVSVQSHVTPGNYIHWSMLDGSYLITREWQEVIFEGDITTEQAGSSGLQTIAFNLNGDDMENNFYFDDIVWEAYTDPNDQGGGSSRQSNDGQFTVTTTTNYTFRLFRDGYLPSVPVTRSYIQTDNRYPLPVVSVVGDKRYFTDPKIGIDCDGDGTNGKTGNGQDVPRNYNQPWDRPVNFSYIGIDGKMLFNQDVDISVSGGWSRSYSIRSLKLKSSKAFDGMNRFDYSFFDQKPYIRNKTLLLRNGGNDTYLNGSRFMDPAMQTVVQRSGIDVDYQSYQPIIEYINGKCRGVLNLREPNNDKFAYANFGYDDEEIDMFENTEFKQGDDVVFNRICELAAHINDAGAYDELTQLLDIDEYTNYMAVELFLGNDDWPNNNIKGYRSRHDGRFRFILFDIDTCFGQLNGSYEDNPFSHLQSFSYMSIVELFLNLLNHDDFRKKFVDTYCIVAGSVFDKNRSVAIAEELAERIRPALDMTGDSHYPDRCINTISERLENRAGRMMSCMEQFKPMKLSATPRQTVTLAADTEGATITVNGINVPYTQFSGKLYSPIRLEAKAPAGYLFTGWRKSSGAMTQIVKMNDTWKYYDKGNVNNDTWTTASFSDASWSSGQAPLGYRMDGVKTTVSYGGDDQRKNPTTYFRKTFTLTTAPTAGDVFQLNYQVDDGCVVWVNGKEAGRVNMNSGYVSYDTFSATYAADEPFTGTIDLDATLFVKGKNVIAVEVHNTSYTSGDLFWAAELFTSVGATDSDGILTDPVINLPEGSKIALTACFTPLTDYQRQAIGLNPVRINEVSADNGIYVNDYYKRNDWVELYNTTNADIDVEGMYLSDNPKKPLKYAISKTNGISTVIPAHGYLIVWCDKLDPLSQLHAPFKLAAEGGDVLLTAADESWTDRITYEPMAPDATVGRYPDGGGNIITMNVPTIANANIMSSYSELVFKGEPTGGVKDMAADNTSGLSLRYVAGRLVIRSTTPLAAADITFFNVAGQTLGQQTVDLSSGYAELSLDNQSSGCYIARLSDGNGHHTTCKYIKK